MHDCQLFNTEHDRLNSRILICTFVNTFFVNNNLTIFRTFVFIAKNKGYNSIWKKKGNIIFVNIRLELTKLNNFKYEKCTAHVHKVYVTSYRDFYLC